MKKFIILLLSLVILIIAELAFFTTISPVCQKEVVFSDAQNNKIDFENLENKYDSSLPGLTTSFLEVTNDNVNELLLDVRFLAVFTEPKTHARTQDESNHGHAL